MSLVLDGSNGLSDVDGTAATPAIRGTDTNTGIFFPAADTIAFSEGGVESMRIDSSGNVGIGTASPTGKATISYSTDGAYNTGLSVTNINAGSSAVAAFQLTNNAGNRAGAYLTSSACSFYGGTNTFNLGTVESIPFTFLTGNTERMRIDSSGNLLVGTTGTGAGAGIVFNYANGGGTYVDIGHPSSAGNGYGYIRFAWNGGIIGQISQNGTTAVTYATSSDYRLKENIAPMTGALATVAKLKPVTYNWKADGSAGQGFIAHELQAVVPDCVTGEKDAVDAEGNPQYQGIDTSFLVATLTAAIQELKTTVDLLSTELDSVKAELTALKGAA